MTRDSRLRERFEIEATSPKAVTFGVRG